MREAIEVLRAMPYAEYLTTLHWRLTRHIAIAYSKRTCQRCFRRGGALDVHHLTYERLGEERIGDLETVCRDCHSYLHATGDTGEGPHTIIGLLARVMKAPQARFGRLIDPDVPVADQATWEDHQAAYKMTSSNDDYRQRSWPGGTA